MKSAFLTLFNVCTPYTPWLHITFQTTHDKVKKRTMQLLKNWSETFKKDESLGIVEETYEALKKSRKRRWPQASGCGADFKKRPGS